MAAQGTGHETNFDERQRTLEVSTLMPKEASAENIALQNQQSDPLSPRMSSRYKISGARVQKQVKRYMQARNASLRPENAEQRQIAEALLAFTETAKRSKVSPTKTLI